MRICVPAPPAVPVLATQTGFEIDTSPNTNPCQDIPIDLSVPVGMIKHYAGEEIPEGWAEVPSQVMPQVQSLTYMKVRAIIKLDENGTLPDDIPVAGINRPLTIVEREIRAAKVLQQSW